MALFLDWTVCLGTRGQFMFTIASGSKQVNYDQLCFDWMRNEFNRISTVRSYWRLTLTCPCDWRLAMADVRWKIDEAQFKGTRGTRKCIYERMPRGFATQVQTNEISDHSIMCLCDLL